MSYSVVNKELPVAVSFKLEHPAVIHYLTTRGESSSAIYRQLAEVYSDTVTYDVVKRWHRSFLEGRMSLVDDERSGRPSVITEDAINMVQDLIDGNRRISVAEIKRYFNDVVFDPISHRTVVEIIRNRLDYRKICARWLPKLLTEEHTANRMAAGLDFLFHYHETSEDFLNRIVTGDEKWVHHFTPEMKSASQQWVGKGDECPMKAKCERSAGKVHLTAFWDNEGILLEKYAPKGITVTRELYFDILMRLREAIKKKCPRKLSRNVFLIHDNVTPHMAGLITSLLADFWWDVFQHPAYSPDLALSDYHLFPALHRWLGGRRFNDDDAVNAAVHEYFAKLDRNFFANGISKLIMQYEKCLSHMEAYAEK